MTDESINPSTSPENHPSSSPPTDRLKGGFERAKQAAKQISDTAKKNFEEVGGMEGLKDKGKEAVNKAKEIGAQGINAAKKKYVEAGGMPGIKSKGIAFIKEVKAGFDPDEGATGLKRAASCVSNLWRSGGAGKITIIVIAAVALIAIGNFGKGSKESESFDNASDEGIGLNSNWTSPGTTSQSESSAPKGKTKKVGTWVCGQCGEQIESTIRPSGKCSKRNNAPHAWTKKGSDEIPDDGQKETIWECRKCFRIVTNPGGSPPSGMRCPMEANAPHRFDKIGEK